MAKTHSDYALSLITQLTLEEKVALLSGHNFMYTVAVPRLNIPAIRMSDGPHGLRVQVEGGDNGVAASLPATGFPTAATSSNSWNPDLLYEMGTAISEEAKHYGIHVLLGPGVCIKRNPLCGRNFEYFSEDPLLAGVLGASEVKGLQEHGVGVSVKHFALNNEENYRFMGNSVVDMRAMREIYLKQFEYIVRNTKPETIMSAYNQINGEFCSENKWLLTDVLREEWGFDGLVMTDWGGVKDKIISVKSGNDIDMPGDTDICRKWLFDAVNNGSLDVSYINECVLNVLDLVNKHKDDKRLEDVDWVKHHELAKRIAFESAVLMKNDGSLPLNKEEKLCIIGELFEKTRFQGSGSSMINPKMLTKPKNIFDDRDVNYVYAKGYKENELVPSQELMDEALETAEEFDKVVVFLGLTDYVESEGGDRETMSLPENQIALVNALVERGKKVVLVLFGGSVIELPFYDKVDAILNMFLPGQNCGESTYELLFGEENPSGKLSETWPIKYEDVPFGDEFGKHKIDVYKESIYVGYRYYLSAKKEVRFPFGYGLSYTKFEYSNLKVKTEDDQLVVTVNVKNVGDRAGKETVQVYAKAPNSDTYKPARELKGFTKVDLKPGESKTAKIIINKNDLRYWNIQANKFVLEDGQYIIQVGENSRDILLEQAIGIKGENTPVKYSKSTQKAYENIEISSISKEVFEEMSGLKVPDEPKVKPITLESRFTDLKSTFMGRILYNSVLSVAKKDMKQALKMTDSIEKENKIKGALFLERILNTNSIRTLSMSGGTGFPYNLAEGFRDLSNGHILKGIKDFTTKIKAPALPTEEVK